jgi:hypothetical protein
MPEDGTLLFFADMEEFPHGSELGAVVGAAVDVTPGRCR